MKLNSRLSTHSLRRLLSTTSLYSQAQGTAQGCGFLKPEVLTWMDRLDFKRTNHQQNPDKPTNPKYSISLQDHRSLKDPPHRQSIPLDPVKLVSETRRLLGEAPTRASAANNLPLAYVRAATSLGKVDPTASWNELISHAMEMGDVVGAYKHFNDMKKRGCFPNNHTYTILLSGLALPHNARSPNALARGLATYRSLRERSMGTKGSQGNAEWNLIHTNAILKLCSRVGALDEVWAIVHELPEKGKNSADQRTYTSLLNCLRQKRGPGGRPESHLNAEPWDLNKIDIVERRKIEQSVDDAERLWGGLLTRSIQGSFEIDEELFCAMARLRLSSTRPRDWGKVFEMMDEVFQVPNFYSDSTSAPTSKKKGTHTMLLNVPEPKTSTFGVLLDSLELVHASPTVAKAYWDHFTTILRVSPDLENYHSYLRALRRSVDGQTAALLIENMVERATRMLNPLLNNLTSEAWRTPISPGKRDPPPLPTVSTFIIALSCCKRLTTSGSATSAPKHSYIYPWAVRILNTFDSLYGLLTSPYLPSPKRTSRTSSASYHYQPKASSIASAESACKIYTKFLGVAKFLTAQDPQVAKQALRRATTPDSEQQSHSKDQESTKTVMSPPDLPTLLTSSKPPPEYATAFGYTILSLAHTLLDDSRSHWGHGEREKLLKNIQILNCLLGQRQPRNESKTNGLTTLEPSDKEYFRTGKRDITLLEDPADAWEPSSRRDREAKRCQKWGKRAKVGAVGSASKTVHCKIDLDDYQQGEASSPGRPHWARKTDIHDRLTPQKPHLSKEIHATIHTPQKRSAYGTSVTPPHHLSTGSGKAVGNLPTSFYSGADTEHHCRKFHYGIVTQEERRHAAQSWRQ